MSSGKGSGDVIAIVDYRAGNLTSVLRALDSLGAPAIITADPDRVARAERVIFPGVGAAGAAMEALTQTGLDQALRSVFDSGRPVLGICIGCQIALDSSEENQAVCLGLIPGRVAAFPRHMTDQSGQRLKVPHMGWNEVRFTRPHPLFRNIPAGAEFYFVHGYHPRPDDPADVWGETEYGIKFASIIGRDNFMAVQFHTEKSGRPGLELLRNFAGWRP